MSTTSSPFDPIRQEQFVVLQSYRRSGDAVPTTVWFAERDGAVYVTTSSLAGKVKRIAINPAVTLTPSDHIGNTHGAPVAGRARLLTPEESARASAALHDKYGDQYVQTVARMDAARQAGTRVFLEILPA
jgi:uncharacterized protein